MMNHPNITFSMPDPAPHVCLAGYATNQSGFHVDAAVASSLSGGGPLDTLRGDASWTSTTPGAARDQSDRQTGFYPPLFSAEASQIHAGFFRGPSEQFWRGTEIPPISAEERGDQAGVFPHLAHQRPPGGGIPHVILTHPRFMQGFFKLLLDSPKICLNFPKNRQTNSQWR